MTGVIKVLTGLGVAVPVAGVAGGTYVAITQSTTDTQETQSLVDSGGSTVSHVSNSLENPDIKVPAQLAKEKETTTGNCIIIDPLKKILEVAKQDETEYYSVFCDNTRMGVAGEGNIPNQWEGAFPKSIFKRQDLGNGQKLEIKVKEEDEDEIFSDHDTGEEDLLFSITLYGNSFLGTGNSSLPAKWDYYEDDALDVEGKVVAKVKLTKPNSSKNIYLLWTKPSES